MRPITLEFQAFGSYPDPVSIDFESLAPRGLYAITGPTGAGKSTIFDAMVYALYGELPGGREHEHPRSHHADEHTKTAVTFTFEVDGVRHVVHRTPTQHVPKQRGQGLTEVSATATLVSVGSDGGITPLASKARDVKAACQKLLGLDADQFQRVVLLPQGEFSRFLLAKDDERETLLRHLFGGHLYERLTMWLKRHVDDLVTQVKGVDTNVEHLRADVVADLAEVCRAWGIAPRRSVGDSADSGDTGDTVNADVDGDTADDLASFDDHSLGELIGELEASADARRADVESADAAASAAVAAANQLAHEVDQFRRLTELRRRATALAAEREARLADESRIAAAGRVRPVVVAANNLDQALATHAEACTARDELAAAVRAAFGELGLEPPVVEAGAIATAVSEVRQRVEADRAALVDLETARVDLGNAATAAEAAVAALDGLTDRHRRSVDEVALIDARLVETEPVAAGVDRARHALVAADESLARRRRLDVLVSELVEARSASETATDAYHDAMRRFVATQAPRLAAALEVDEPCPVCGSCEHPAPAVDTDVEPIDHDQVSAAMSAMNASVATATGIAGTVAELRSSLADDADQAVEVLLARRDQCQAELQDAEAALSETTDLRARRAVLADEVEAVAAELQTAIVARAEAEKERAAVQSTFDDAARAAAHLDSGSVATAARIVESLTDIALDASTVLGAVTSAQGAIEQARTTLHEALRTSGCADVDAARSAWLSEDDESELRIRVDAWSEASTKVDAGIAEIERTGLPAFADIEAAEVEMQAADRAAQAAKSAAGHERDRFVTAMNALRSSRTALDRLGQVIADSASLRERRDLAVQVHATCAGKSGSAGPLDRWVLGGELERVAQAANVHLARMTAHRYAFQRPVDAKSALTLEVFDAYTGRTRSSHTLSGGEQFQASLALALGLAEVVGHGGSASGRTFETLFVDEGFGSLDPDALGAAMDALMLLQEGGRVVGVITHVEAMKSTIHPGIEVMPLDGRAGSRLVVRP